MHAALLSLVLSCLGPGPDSATIAPALVRAVEWRAEHGLPPVTESPTLDLVLLATYVRHESSATLDPAPVSSDARERRSCGMLQLPCSYVRRHSPAAQAHYWLGCVSASSLADVDSWRRLAEARAALSEALVAAL